MQKKEKPIVNPHDWITIGSNGSKSLYAVVCQVYEDDDPADIEVVYMNNKKRETCEDLIWHNGCWEFKKEGPAGGGDAGGISRLSDYVAQLKRGRFNS